MIESTSAAESNSPLSSSSKTCWPPSRTKSGSRSAPLNPSPTIPDAIACPKTTKHREQLARVQQLVEQSNLDPLERIGSGRIHAAQRRNCESVDVEQLITQIIAARPPSLDPPLNCELAADLPLVLLDSAYARALIENLLGLFRQLATKAHPARLRALAVGGGIEIDLTTGVPGYRSIAYLPPGSALSLDCAEHVLAIHGGALLHSIDPASGIRVRVMLP